MGVFLFPGGSLVSVGHVSALLLPRTELPPCEYYTEFMKVGETIFVAVEFAWFCRLSDSVPPVIFPFVVFFSLEGCGTNEVGCKHSTNS